MSARVSYSELIARAREKRDAEYKKLSSFTISQIETATEKATHRWSWANACLYKQDNSQIKCAANAVLGFIQSIEKREESFSDMIQMIYLVFTANFSEIEIQKIGEKLLKFDTKFLQISSQLFAKLGKPSSQSQQLVIKLLQKLFKVHYHSLLFPLLLCIRENLPNSIRIDQDVTFQVYKSLHLKKKITIMKKT
ncbi:hypothetical protein TVAG_129550 [Trichomonas vaginalis G3]|uniref:Uncharacterized protein n=1 Tax=Trichomonas vaginalis (strain ATCC PRA-98 / G3) TaxID=412133 RepID=A2DI51_TRIV3|nr:protein serine/threonine kinase protein [Trichomonas vaginalis G3]EAY19847.1 hypothetical protein TVAG_129550 [Trichomonas vaginalis G3]KAI5510024.1 protein serine/threonine kinase protein [Trichomonas vaginalis G3]|eukprot:XP_001580833.1 hypothetical protein [Trichomonas vaginalis G3]